MRRSRSEASMMNCLDYLLDADGEWQRNVPAEDWVALTQMAALAHEAHRYRKALRRIAAAGGYATPEPLKRMAREALDE
jgi:hypothetical protein